MFRKRLKRRVEVISFKLHSTLPFVFHDSITKKNKMTSNIHQIYNLYIFFFFLTYSRLTLYIKKNVYVEKQYSLTFRLVQLLFIKYRTTNFSANQCIYTSLICSVVFRFLFALSILSEWRGKNSRGIKALIFFSVSIFRVKASREHRGARERRAAPYRWKRSVKGEDGAGVSCIYRIATGLVCYWTIARVICQRDKYERIFWARKNGMHRCHRKSLGADDWSRSPVTRATLRAHACTGVCAHVVIAPRESTRFATGEE